MKQAAIRSVTRTIRDRMPPRLRRWARNAVLAWGMATARWRLLPDIIVVGAQRSGTTTLFHLLEQHPQLVRPTVTKGTGYFDDQFHRGPRWYAAHFPLRLTARLLVRNGTARTFECSGYYVFHPLAAERIARYLPEAQVVVLVRDPVERAHSAHRHEAARGFEDLEFEHALAMEGERLEGEEERLVLVPGSTSHHHRHHAYVGRSTYLPQIQRLVATVGRDRVHVVEAERFFADPSSEFNRLQAALGLDQWTCGPTSAWNARPGNRLDPELNTLLRKRFDDSDRGLEGILGHPPVWREDD